MDLFKITPITFILDMYDSHYTAEYQQFTKFFKEFEKKNPSNNIEEVKAPSKTPTSKREKEKDSKETKKSTTKQSTTPRITHKPLQMRLPETYYDGCNLWLLKPTDYNRGRGINLFNKMTTLEHYLKCFQNNTDENGKKLGSSSTTKSSNSSSINLVKSHRFVVQKYIEKPLLINNRKFDTRIWALIDQDMNLYWFKEGYLRLSSEPFGLSQEQAEDKYIHLTNNAVQKYGKNYGLHESGNIISLDELQVIILFESGLLTNKIELFTKR